MAVETNHGPLREEASGYSVAPLFLTGIFLSMTDHVEQVLPRITFCVHKAHLDL